MQEAEWLSSTDPAAMLTLLQHWNEYSTRPTAISTYRTSDRKLRLWVEACRAGRDDKPWGSYDLDTPSGLRAACERWARCDHQSVMPVNPLPVRAALLRDIIGNPFRLVSLEKCPRCDGDGKAHGSDRPFEWTPEKGYPGPCPVCDGFRFVRPPWLTRDALRLAQTCYEERGQDGHLDSALLALLADELEGAGCTDAELLQHLRGLEWCPECQGRSAVDPPVANWCTACTSTGWRPLRSGHVRGCWAVDLIWNKE